MTEKIVIYQLFPRLFGNNINSQKPWGKISENGSGKFNDISESALESLLELGINHIWLTGIIRHASGTAYPEFNLTQSHPQIIKGLAGSPYAIKDYYDIDPDLAIRVDKRMDEFEELIIRIHKHGIKVLVDFVPNHVSRDYKSTNKPSNVKDLGEGDDQSVYFSKNNNFYYLPGQNLSLPMQYDHEAFWEEPAKATGNNLFSPSPSMQDWYETVKLNYGVEYPTAVNHFEPIPDTWIKMKDILLFWSLKGVDGFRCDMAGMVPLEFWKYGIGKIREEFPDILFIAELYEPERYRGFIEIARFDFLYDKVGLYDCLRDIICGVKSTEGISKAWERLDGLDRHMLRFMENHDEQRIASNHFAGDAWKGIPAMAICTLMNSGPVMLYNGQEVGEEAVGSTGFSGDDGRTSIYDYSSMPELQKWRNQGACDEKLLDLDKKLLRETYSSLFHFARIRPEIQGQFYDLMWQNQDMEEQVKSKIYAFLRYKDNSVLLIGVCFSQEIMHARIRIPVHALEMAGLAYRESFNINQLHPSGHSAANLMISQLTGAGVLIEFDRSGWAAISLS